MSEVCWARLWGVGKAVGRRRRGETRGEESAGVMHRRGEPRVRRLQGMRRSLQGETSAGVMCAEEGRLGVSRGDAQKKGGKTRGVGCRLMQR